MIYKLVIAIHSLYIVFSTLLISLGYLQMVSSLFIVIVINTIIV